MIEEITFKIIKFPTNNINEIVYFPKACYSMSKEIIFN